MEVPPPDSFNSDLASEKALVADLCTPLSPRRRALSALMTGVTFTLAALAILPLFSLLFTIAVQGFSHLSWDLFTSLPAPIGMKDVPNGFANAILGTLMMVGIAALMSIPVGVGTAILLVEFLSTSPIAAAIRFTMQVLSGVPSIVVGVFAYALIVVHTKTFSAWAGAIALAVMMLPIITLTTEEALKLIPMSLRTASLGLGAYRYQTVFRIVLPAALPGIVTGVLLAVARAAGETAPLLFTALFSLNWPEGLNTPTPSLSVLIYNYASSPFVEQNEISWTASLVLVSIVLVTSILSRLATQRRLKLR